MVLAALDKRWFCVQASPLKSRADLAAGCCVCREINDFSRSLRRGEIYIFNAAGADEWLNASPLTRMLLDQKGRRLINGCTLATLSFN